MRWETAYYALRTVDWTAVQALPLVGRVLYLQSCFYMLDWCGNEGDCEASHNACDGMAEGGEFVDGILNGFLCGSNGGWHGFPESF